MKMQAVGMRRQEQKTKMVVGKPQIRQSLVGSGDSTAFLPKPPTKQINSVNHISSRTAGNASSCATRAKTENNIVKADAKASKLLSLGGPDRRVPKPAMVSSPAAKVHLGSSGSSSSDKRKSLSISGRRKTMTKMSENSNLSACLVSPKICSSLSPASSISDWSSESSSSSTVNQMFDRSSASLETSSCRSFDSNTLPRSAVAQLPRQNTVVASTHALPAPASTKPSGLRLPSPKIGFFDGGKSMTRTPNGSSQSQHILPTSLPKIRPTNSISRRSNKENVRKM